MLIPILKTYEVQLNSIWLQKNAPGQPPRPGLEWKEETHRWIRPKENISSNSIGNNLEENNINIIQRYEKWKKSYDDKFEEVGTKGIGDIPGEYAATQIWGPQKTNVVDSDIFEKIPGDIIYRGVSNIEHLDSNINAGFYGLGMFGNGQYYSKDEKEASLYASKEGHIHRAKLNPESNLLTIENAEGFARFKDHQSPKEILAKCIEDGFEAMYIANVNHYIFFNKRAIIVDRSSLPPGY